MEALIRLSENNFNIVSETEIDIKQEFKHITEHFMVVNVNETRLEKTKKNYIGKPKFWANVDAKQV